MDGKEVVKAIEQGFKKEVLPTWKAWAKSVIIVRKFN